MAATLIDAEPAPRGLRRGEPMFPEQNRPSEPNRHAGTLLLAGFRTDHPLIRACDEITSAALIVAPDPARIPARLLQATRLDLAIVVVTNHHAEALATVLQRRGVPWAALADNNRTDLHDRLYRAGASLVLNAGADIQPLLALARRFMRHGDDASNQEPSGHERHYRAGERVYPEPGEWWLVQFGLMFVEFCDHDGNENIVDILGPGELHHAVDTHLHRGSVHACADSLIRRLSPERIRSDHHLMELVIQRQRWLSQLALARGERDLECRLLAVLALLAERHGFRDGKDLIVRPKLTHAQIASFCGTTRATVTRRLNHLRDSGRIRGYLERDGTRTIAIAIT